MVVRQALFTLDSEIYWFVNGWPNYSEYVVAAGEPTEIDGPIFRRGNNLSIGIQQLKDQLLSFWLILDLRSKR